MKHQAAILDAIVVLERYSNGTETALTSVNAANCAKALQALVDDVPGGLGRRVGHEWTYNDIGQVNHKAAQLLQAATTKEKDSD